MSARAARIAILACIVAGCGLRWVPLANDFWLDEIWTWEIATRLGSWLEIFTSVHHSNNHHLNTLVFYILGDSPHHWSVYRLPAFLAGSCSVGLGAAIAYYRGREEALLAALLLATNFALIHFSSEARGYASMLFFCLLAHWALERNLDSGRLAPALLYGAALSLGFLSQLFTVFYFAGAAAQSASVLWQREIDLGRRTGAMLRLHALPLLVLAVLWWVDLRELRVEGGNPLAPYWLVSRLFGYGFGLPVLRVLAIPYALLFLLALGFGLRNLKQRGDPLWLGVAVTAWLAPVLTLLLLRPDVVAVRYFLVPIAFCLIALAVVAGPVLRRPGAPRSVVVALIGLLILGNGFHTFRFFQDGRGGYSAALALMAERSPGGRIEVGSDHDFRNGSVLRFYARYLPPSKRLDYRPRNQWPPGGPDWLVIHRPERPAHSRDRLELPGGERYRLEAEFDHAALSGFYWAVYRNAAPRELGLRSSTTTPKP